MNAIASPMSRRPQPARAGRALLAPLAAVLALAGCSSHQDELRTWMDQVRAQTPVKRETVPEPKRFEPFRYEVAHLTEPFAQVKLTAVIEKMATKPGGMAPDTNRRREALENFPLDAIRMVGHMTNGKQHFALLQVDNLVYQARVGQYAGQNFGRIVRITETEVGVKELVQDAAGDWVERDAALRLQEKTR